MGTLARQGVHFGSSASSFFFLFSFTLFIPNTTTLYLYFSYIHLKIFFQILNKIHWDRLTVGNSNNLHISSFLDPLKRSCLVHASVAVDRSLKKALDP